MIPEKMWKADLQEEVRQSRIELEKYRNAEPLIVELIKLLSQKWIFILTSWNKINSIIKALKTTY